MDMNEKSAEEIVKELNVNNYQSFSEKKLSEEILSEVAAVFLEKEQAIVEKILDYMINNSINEECDWNIGSTIQHFSIGTIMDAIEKITINKKPFLYDSIGLAWALGDSNTKNEKVIEFLYEVMNYARNPESWWRAAFGIEKLTGKNAINNLKRSLKKDCINSLDECLNNLYNKRNVIGLLFHANSKEIKEKIYPRLKQEFYLAIKNEDTKLLLNVIWLFGRLRLYDYEIYNEINKILKQKNDYEIVYYIFQSMSDDPKELFYDKFISCLNDEDPLIRKMALRGLGKLDCNINIKDLEKMLECETNISVTGEITKTIYKMKNYNFLQKNKIYKKYIVNENGLIGDDSDKWYADAGIYNVFSENEDIENICFNLIAERIKQEKIEVVNPIDLACGTGRTTKNILNNIKYNGTLYSVDLSNQMLEFLQKTIDRQKYYVDKVELVQSTIDNFKLPKRQKSTLIISSFGFPSKIFNPERCKKELEAVYNNLDDKGVFVTIGWDESFNDELNEMWYRYIPDTIRAHSFEEWRNARSLKISTARNCNLTWYKKNLQIPLIFDSLEESVNVMGHLFGRDAAMHILDTEKRIWWMAMGITWNTKQELKNILKEMK